MLRSLSHVTLGVIIGVVAYAPTTSMVTSARAHGMHALPAFDYVGYVRPALPARVKPHPYAGAKLCVDDGTTVRCDNGYVGPRV